LTKRSLAYKNHLDVFVKQKLSNPLPRTFTPDTFENVSELLLLNLYMSAHNMNTVVICDSLPRDIAFILPRFVISVYYLFAHDS
jgi:hypothetical protein